VSESQGLADRAFNDERPSMHRPMVGATERDELIGVVPAALGARYQVMQVDVGRVPAARHHAAPVIASQHVPADSWRDGLGRARQGGRMDAPVGVDRLLVEPTELLSIAGRHLDDLGLDLDGLAASLHGSPPAVLADRQRQLVARLA
jgi:hypothetical protein